MTWRKLVPIRIDPDRIIPMDPVGIDELSISMDRDAGIRQRFAIDSKPKPRKTKAKKAKAKDE